MKTTSNLACLVQCLTAEQRPLLLTYTPTVWRNVRPIPCIRVHTGRRCDGDHNELLPADGQRALYEAFPSADDDLDARNIGRKPGDKPREAASVAMATREGARPVSRAALYSLVHGHLSLSNQLDMRG
ncbi:hypothetical protein MSG28_010253 [Choristoneura fumiferana]|uniref:Uncharacterized protein n=1 Tax=Choristoneura fumiferana TaxID=7141 RepID=A0ACC0KJT7_CHOFU|nr:hypothetical protein MSG28_010253 [Choristoneura fumiferana]